VFVCDPDKTTVAQVKYLEKQGIKVRFRKSYFDNQRMIKTTEEVKKIIASQHLNEQVLKQLTPWIKEGMSETDIATKVLTLELELGSSGPSFHPIVAFEE